MKNHEMNEKNQVEELSKVELSDLSEDEMRSTSGGAQTTHLKLAVDGNDGPDHRGSPPNAQHGCFLGVTC